MEEEFKVIDNYLMVRMPAEVDHHASEYIGRTADRFWRQGFCGQCGCKDQKDTDALRIA